MASSLIIKPGGKGETVIRRLEDGTEDRVCNNNYSGDGCTGCIGRIPVELLGEVIENFGTYSKERIDRYTANKKNKYINDSWTPNGYCIEEVTEEYKKKGEIPPKELCSETGYALPKEQCVYCYAQGYNAGNVTPREITKKTLESLTVENPDIIRFGKKTEFGHPFHWKTFKDIFGIINDRNIQWILPNKMLTYGIEGAKELSKFSRGNNDIVYQMAKNIGLLSGEEVADIMGPNGSLNFSIGNDRMELGPCSQGFTNEFRITQGIKFYQNGPMNTSLWCAVDVTHSIKHNAEMGNSIRDALDAMEKYGIPVRILPLKIKSDVTSRLATGKSRKELMQEESKNQILLGDEHKIRSSKYFAVKRNGELSPKEMHPDFQNLRDEHGLGFCGLVGETEYCDKCNLPGMENERISFPANELIERDTSEIEKIKFKIKDTSGQIIMNFN